VFEFGQTGMQADADERRRGVESQFKSPCLASPLSEMEVVALQDS
jgi:hypothetical protein